MDICYFPGCTLKTEAKELDLCARKVAEKLGVNMVEIKNWQCCGAEYATARDEIANKLSSVRALDYAKHNGGKLLTLCSACHNVIKRVNDDAKNDEHFGEAFYKKLPQTPAKIFIPKDFKCIVFAL